MADTDGDGYNDGVEVAAEATNDAQSLPFSINPETADANPLNDSLSFDVNAAAGVEWSAESLAEWLTITGGASGTGPGSVTYTVDRNSSAEEREGRSESVLAVGRSPLNDNWSFTTR